MFYLSHSAIISALVASVVVSAGPVKPVDECKDVKKEVQSLQEPKIRKAASAYCSQNLGLEVITESDWDVVETTDFNLPPETYTPYDLYIAPPGTITETDTSTKTIDTYTILLTQFYYCYETTCPLDWAESTILMTAYEITATTVFRTVTQSPNPLPQADPTKLAKACACLSLPYVTITSTDTYTIVYAAVTETIATETFTNYDNVVLEIETTTIESGTSTITLPIPIIPHIEYATVFSAWPTYIETVTIYPASQIPGPHPTKKPNHPKPTRSKTTHAHPPKMTKPPRKGGKNHKAQKGGQN